MWGLFMMSFAFYTVIEYSKYPLILKYVQSRYSCIEVALSKPPYAATETIPLKIPFFHVAI